MPNTLSRPVAYFSPAWPPKAVANGIVTYVDGMCAGLQEYGVGSYITSTNMHGSLSEAGPRAIELKPQTKRTLWTKVRERLVGSPSPAKQFETYGVALAQSFADLYTREPFSLLEMEESFGWARSVIEPAQFPVVVRLHGPWCMADGIVTEQQGHRERIEEERRLIASAPYISVPSRSTLEGVRNYYHLELQHAVVIPNPAPPPPDGLQWSFDTCDRNLLLFVGRIDLIKGADVVLSAFEMLARDFPALHLNIAGPAGEGLPLNGKMCVSPSEYIKQTIADESIRRRIHWLGSVSPGDLWKLRTQALATLSASRREVQSMAMLECGTVGAPFICSSISAFLDVIKNDEDGLIFENGNPKELARCVRRVLDSPEIAVRIAGNLQRRITGRFGIREISRQMIDYYEDVLARFDKTR